MIPRLRPKRESVCESKRGRKRERGQALVELAMIAPVLLIIMLGVIDFGRVYFAYVAVTNGARNGADYASGGSEAAADLEAIRAAVVADTNDLLDTSSTNPDVSVVTSTDDQGRLYADVTVQYTFTSIFDWPGLPHSVDVERTVRSRVSE